MDERMLRLQTAVREYFDLETKLFRTNHPMTEQTFDATVTLFEQARERIFSLIEPETTE